MNTPQPRDSPGFSRGEEVKDEVVSPPPSTVFAAVNAHAGATELSVWRYNGYEGGGIDDDAAALRFLDEQLGVTRG
ncbi:hypothetical protein [Micromonospora sp. NPDC051006]|uniref:hypothetical protein n=1 Tax=Micromonospora sp. NPDC051006 TaxID=3364283 RepID=UPI00379386E3